jgi:hypothetical protein
MEAQKGSHALDQTTLSSFVSTITLTFMSPLIKIGGDLRIEDITEMAFPQDERVENVEKKFDVAWQKLTKANEDRSASKKDKSLLLFTSFSRSAAKF